jgi:hypothetical protein
MGHQSNSGFGFNLAADGLRLEPHPVEYPVLVRILMLWQVGLGGRRPAKALTAERHQPRGWLGTMETHKYQARNQYMK